MHTLIFMTAAISLASTPSPATVLKQFLKPAEWQTQQKYSQAYQKVKKQADFIRVFRQAQDIQAAAAIQKQWDFYQDDPGKRKQPDFTWLKPFYPGLELTFQAEGTAAVMSTVYPEFAQLAKITPELQDDQFINLMHRLHGDVDNGYRTWMERTWDYGGCSYLGSNKHSQFLKEIQTQLKNKSPFQTELKEEQARLVQDLTQAESICGSRQAALIELQQVQKNFSWSKSEKQALQTRVQQIKSGKIPDQVLNPS